jgi:ribosomal peptide maturation radical SAM protein 1
VISKQSCNDRQQEKDLFQVALVSMPWSIFNRPSIQLGALKAYLNNTFDWISVRNFHPYLDVAKLLGPEVYHEISLHVWNCESLYTPLVFPELQSVARKVFEKEARSSKILKAIDFDETVRNLESTLKGFVDSVEWNTFQLVGFTVCFNQLFPTLAVIKQLKEQYPDVPVVVGGSSCPDDLVGSLVKLAAIDYVISGEGEKTLAGLCGYLAKKTNSMPGNVYAPQNNGSKCEYSNNVQVKTLANLPAPDYDDYFTDMRRVFAKEPFIPTLPIEFSRGCWWRKCAFCNLNLQWQGYRFKESKQMVEEVVNLSEKYRSLEFAFTDNALPVKQSVGFFDKVAAIGRDLSFFGEIRASMRGEKLAACRQGGLNVVQVGIESLSSSLLDKMVKGTSAIENVAIMKDAVANGVQLEGNLIVEFPGSTEAEVDETLANLDFVLPFHPLATAAFFLGHGSPVCLDPDKYGINAVLQHPRFKQLFPRDLLPQLSFLIKGYRGDRKFQKRIWKPVVQKVNKWQKFHQQRKCSTLQKPALSYRDGGNFLIIRQELPGKSALHHTLRGLSREIYLACEGISGIDMLADMFPKASREKIANFLGDLVKKRLIFNEKDSYLALAVQAK